MPQITGETLSIDWVACPECMEFRVANECEHVDEIMTPKGDVMVFVCDKCNTTQHSVRVKRPWGVVERKGKVQVH